MKRPLVCLLVLCLVTGATRTLAQAPTTTTISDVLYRADGTPAGGTLLITWPAFATASGKAVAAGSKSVTIGAGGSVSVSLVPNESANPSGTYYRVVYKLDDGSTSEEIWSVPNVPTTTISAIRSTVVPSGVAIQVASKQYVDSAIAAATGSSTNFHNVRYCDQFGGANAGAKIAACIADLPSTGGIVDARGLEGTQVISSTLTVNKPVHLLLGAATFDLAADDTGVTPSISITSSNVAIEGIGEQTVLSVTGWTTQPGADRRYIAAQASADTGLENVHFKNFKLLGDKDVTMSAGGGGVYGITFGGTTINRTVSNSGVENVIFEKNGGMSVVFTGGSNSGEPQSRNNYVTNSVFFNGGDGGVNAVSGGVADATISNNRFYKLAGLAIEWAGMSSVISGNTFDEIKNSAYSLENGTTQTGWNYFIGNTIRDTGQVSGTQHTTCIQLGQSVGAIRAVVANNSLYRCYGQGIALGGSSTSDLHIHGNLIDGFGFNGSGKTIGFGSWAGIDLINKTRVYVTDNVVRSLTGAGDRSDYGMIVGGTLSTDNWVDGNITLGAFLVKAALLPTSVGLSGAGTRNFIGHNWDMQNGKVIPQSNNLNNEEIPVLATNSATPSVAGSDVWFTSNSASTTITDFLNSYVGQVLTVFSVDANTTIANNANILLQGGVNRTLASGEVIQLVRSGAGGGVLWKEVGLTANQTFTGFVAGASFRSTTANVAATGQVRLASGDALNFRNNANSADVNGLSKDASDVVQVGGAAGARAIGPFTVDNQMGLRLNEADAGGDEFLGLRAKAAIASSRTLTLNLPESGNCTGTNGGALTILSDEIVCSDDDGGGSGGGDAVEVEDGDNGGTFTAIDTTLRLEDQGDIDFQFTDGGAGGPDTVVGVVRANSVALAADTTGNFVGTVVAGTGIAVTGADAENATKTVALGFADTLAANPALNAEECVFSTDGTGGGLLCEGATADSNEGLVVFPFTGSDKTITFFDATDTVVGRATTDTLTNKTLDVEGAGNSVTTVSKIFMDGAGCQNATALSNWDLPTASAAVAACRTGTNTQQGTLDFATDSGTLTAQRKFRLPSDWATGSNLDAIVTWNTSAITNDVVWQIAIACASDADSDDPSFTDDAFPADTAKGTANQINDTAVNTVTTTGACAAGDMAFVRIKRDPAHVSDTLAAGTSARLIGVELTIRRTQ